MVVLGVIWMNQHGFLILGIQNDLFTFIKWLKSVWNLMVLRLSSFGCKWLQHASWAWGHRGCVSGPQIPFLSFSRSFPISVLGGTVHQTLALNFKLLGLFSRQRCLVGSKALSISANSTIGSMSPLFFKEKVGLVSPWDTVHYFPMCMLIIPCYWVIFLCKAL